MNKWAKVGSLLEIPFANNRKAVAHFLYRDRRNGDLVRIFKKTFDQNEGIDIDAAINSDYLFPEVYTMVLAALKTYNWKIIRFLPVENYKYPGFLNGWTGFWSLWTKDSEIDLGERVPKKYHNLEYLSLYSPYLIAKRAIDGTKPYDREIKENIVLKNSAVLPENARNTIKELVIKGGAASQQQLVV